MANYVQFCTRQSAHSLWPQMKLDRRVYRETGRRAESKECLCKVCVFRHKAESLLSCLCNVMPVTLTAAIDLVAQLPGLPAVSCSQIYRELS